MIELESVIADDKTYAVINKVIDDNVTYVFLINPDNHDDTMIRKVIDNEDAYLPLESDKEFELACLLLFKGNKANLDD